MDRNPALHDETIWLTPPRGDAENAAKANGGRTDKSAGHENARRDRNARDDDSADYDIDSGRQANDTYNYDNNVQWQWLSNRQQP